MLAGLAKSKDVQALASERLPHISCKCLELWDAKPPLHRFGLEAHAVPSNFDNLAIGNFATQLRHWNRHVLKQRLYRASVREDQMRVRFDQNGCVCTGRVFVLAVLSVVTAIVVRAFHARYVFAIALLYDCPGIAFNIIALPHNKSMTCCRALSNM